MTRRQLLAMAAGASFLGRGVSHAQENLDPLKLMPDTHKLVFENEFVRVIESRLPPGHSEPKHAHPRNVTVHLADVDTEIRTLPDGPTTRAHASAATASWGDATVHEVKNVGTTASHNFRIELKQA